MGRGPVLERLEHRAEPLLHLVERVALEVEAAGQQVALPDPDRAAAELPAVEHDVVLHRMGAPGRVVGRPVVEAAGDGRQERLLLGNDAAERVVRRVPARLLSASHLYIGKRWTQQYASSSAFASPSRPPSSTRRRPSTSLATSAASATIRIRSPGAAPAVFANRCLRLGRQELRNGAGQLAAVGDGKVDEPAGAEALGELGQVVDLAAGHAAHARRSDALDAAARRQRLVEHAESRGRSAVRTDERGREVEQLHREPDVGLVRPVALDRLLVREDRERDVAQRPLGDHGPRDLDRHRLHERHHRRLVDEAHLEVELRELGLAVASQVLVTEAARDLEVAVDAGHHQQLLELLGALGQRVDGARLEAAGDDEVARPLRRALDEVRRLDLDELVRVVDLADRLDQAAAQEQAALHGLAPDVEVPVAEAQGLVDRRVGVVDVERRRLRVVEDPDRARLELDRPRRQLRVLGPGLAERDLALERDDELGSQPGRGLARLGRVPGVDHHLRDAVPVAEVDEGQLPVVAAAVHPAGEAGRRPGVVGPEGAAGVGAVRGGEAWGRCRHGRVS